MEPKRTDHIIAEPETNGINLYNERSIHADVKRWYARPGDRFEVGVDGYVIDIVRGELLIEVQTSSFGALKTKLCRLLQSHDVRLVYPVTREKRIMKYDQTGAELLSNRRSPRRGRVTDLFDEIVYLGDVLRSPRLSVDVLLVDICERRRDDGKGSWRRKGVSIVGRELLRVHDSSLFAPATQAAELLPDGLPVEFTNGELAKAAKLRARRARKMSYTLCSMGAIDRCGKRGRAHLFRRTRQGR